jgi:hypothetical protein
MYTTETKKRETWAKVVGEQSHFPFSGQPDTNIGLAQPNNELEYFELSITSQIVELISIETTCNGQQFFEICQTQNKFKSPPQAWHNNATNIPFATRN